MYSVVSDASGHHVRVGLITNHTTAQILNIHHGWALKTYTSIMQTQYRQIQLGNSTDQNVSRRVASFVHVRAG
jgi:hypothetical protein